jgi:outer membrane immunogenic protein
MRTWAHVSAFVSLIATSVILATVPAGAQQYDWSGLYLGLNAGGIWSDIEHDHYSESVAPGPFILTPSFNSGILGGHIGYQYQFGGGLIIGAEAAISTPIGDPTASQTCPPPITPNTACEQSLSRLFTVGPRIGWGFDNWMIFGTGGYARAHLDSDYRNQTTGQIAFPTFSGSSSNNGWFAGGGVEWAMTNNVILGLEYQHFELDSERATPQLSANDNDNIALSAEGDIVRARLSFKLGRSEPDFYPLK